MEFTQKELMSSIIFGLFYFVILFSPILYYIKSFVLDKNEDKKIIFEILGKGLFIQISALVTVVVLAYFIEHIALTNDFRPSKSLEIFFGTTASDLIDVRWNEISNISLQSSSINQLTYHEDAKLVAFSLIGWLGFLYRLLIITLFLVMIWNLLTVYIKTSNKQPGEVEANMFQKLYTFFGGFVLFITLIYVHASVAKAYPAFFGINPDGIAINFIAYAQKVISDLLYDGIIWQR